MKAEITMKTQDGDIVKNLLNDKYYTVKRIVNSGGPAIRRWPRPNFNRG